MQPLKPNVIIKNKIYKMKYKKILIYNEYYKYMITCQKCSKTFTYNYLLLKHMNRKKSCSPLNNDDKLINDVVINNDIINTNTELKRLNNMLNYLKRKVIQEEINVLLNNKKEYIHSIEKVSVEINDLKK